ncbi:M56 family metallopeptidase [Flavitalea sp.]|nr:M56 family metallopeptidase [Flavitalea sp.]
MIAYLIKVMLCSGLFIIIYKLLLEKEKMFRFNRAYLLFTMLLSFTIPALTFKTFSADLPAIQELLLTTNISAAINPVQSSPMMVGPNPAVVVLFTVYIVISTILLFRFIINFAKILSTVRTKAKIQYRTSHIVLIPGNQAPHSFLHYIFINEKDFQTGKIENEILAHEFCHVEQKHSYDIIFIELLLTIFWFNPFLYLFKKSLRLNHEFLADETVIQGCSSIGGYQNLLIRKYIQPSASYFTSQFNYLTTKKRLIMMTKPRSFTIELMKQIFLIPVLALSVLIFSTNTIAQQSSPVKQKNKKKRHQPRWVQLKNS